MSLATGAERFLPSEPGERIITLLPYQREWLGTTKPKSVVKAGWGSGKTRGLGLMAMRLGQANPGLAGLFAAPSYSMLEDSIIPDFEDLLFDMGFAEGEDYELRRRPPQKIWLRIDGAEFGIRYRSSDNPQGLVSHTVPWALVDEAAFMADERIDAVCARVRHPKTRFSHIGLGSTPETMSGRFFEWATADDPLTHVITARSTDNVFLPPGFVEHNLAHLSEQDRKRYIGGEFITPGGRVYTCYDVDEHEQRCRHPGAGSPVMACDFGYGCMPWIFGHVIGGQRVHFFGEQVLEGDNTWQAVLDSRIYWQRYFQKHHGVELSPEEAAGRVDVYADPAGGKDYGKSDIQLLERGGYSVYHRRRHPPVRDRVNAVQMKLHKRELYVDAEHCPYLAKCFRYHAYDPNTGFPKKHRSREGKKGLDHGVDAVGYLVEYRWSAGGRVGRFLGV